MQKYLTLTHALHIFAQSSINWRLIKQSKIIKTKESTSSADPTNNIERASSTDARWAYYELHQGTYSHSSHQSRSQSQSSHSITSPLPCKLHHRISAEPRFTPFCFNHKARHLSLCCVNLGINFPNPSKLYPHWKPRFG